MRLALDSRVVRSSALLRAAAALTVVLSFTAPAHASAAAELVREARAHEAAHEDDLALRRYTDALSLDPTYGEAYLGLGALRARRGDAREAERVYSVALAHLPTLKSALVGRAQARWTLGFRDEAELDLEEYTRSQDDPAALRQLAGWYADESRSPAQLATWRRLRALAARNGDVPLEREARTMIRALQILVGDCDPASAPAATDRIRRGIAAVARRGGG
jgi:tetratricopeptide (TPR) repeat protein